MSCFCAGLSLTNLSITAFASDPGLQVGRIDLAAGRVRASADSEETVCPAIRSPVGILYESYFADRSIQMEKRRH